MENWSKKLELISNVVVILLAIVLGVALFTQYILPKQSTFPSNNTINFVGKELNIDGVDWSQNSKTIVLALSSNCGHCTTSLPFYQKLVRLTAQSNTKIVAVFNQPLKEGQEYLAKHGVQINEIIQKDFKNINVKGTPTLIIVNDKGIITDYFVGAVNESREADILSKLGIQQNS